jgi:hypothetical protein
MTPIMSEIFQSHYLQTVRKIFHLDLGILQTRNFLWGMKVLNVSEIKKDKVDQIPIFFIVL